MPLDPCHQITIERLFDGRPILPPSDQWWDSGTTFNSAAVLLTAIPENLSAFHALMGVDQEQRDIVALHYRARPKSDPNYPWPRSFIGLSVHEPDLTLIRRFSDPVLSPGELSTDVDYLGVEDPRITCVDGSWWMVYCGVMPITREDPLEKWLGSVCLAKSEDLVHWTKYGAIRGTGDGFSTEAGPARVSNKDAVLFPDRIDGKVVKLHRPMSGPAENWGTSIAIADHVEGPFEDLGLVRGAIRSPDYETSWVGAGAVPVPIGKGRYLSIEHTGNLISGVDRKYVLDALLYDFNKWDKSKPQSLVAARIDDFLRPETYHELNGPTPDSVANVVFSCGSYVHDGWLYIVYGGGDSYVLGARLRFDELVNALEKRVHA